MKTYKYNINGNDYEVAVEGIENYVATVTVNGESYTVKMPEPEKPAHHPVVVKPAGVPAVIDKPKKYGVKAPLPGVIVDVKVKPGDEIKRGDTVVILDAMKMENNITSDRAGKIAEICVAPGESVMEAAAFPLGWRPALLSAYKPFLPGSPGAVSIFAGTMYRCRCRRSAVSFSCVLTPNIDLPQA